MVSLVISILPFLGSSFRIVGMSQTPQAPFPFFSSSGGEAGLSHQAPQVSFFASSLGEGRLSQLARALSFTSTTGDGGPPHTSLVSDVRPSCTEIGLSQSKVSPVVFFASVSPSQEPSRPKAFPLDWFLDEDLCFGLGGGLRVIAV